MSILIVEDEPRMSRLIAAKLDRAGFKSKIASNLATAREAVSKHPFRVVLLDRRLPDGEGMALVPEIRREQPDARVLMVTALDAVTDRIECLESGADDYLTKPFDGDELVARIRAQLRRAGDKSEPIISCGALRFDPARRTATVSSHPLILHGKELALLECLIRNLGRATPRRLLIAEVYGGSDEAGHASKLEMLVSRLRQRLMENDAGVAIHTVRGIGYVLNERRA